MGKHAKIALIGAGHMGGALLARWLESGIKGSEILVVDPKPGAVVTAIAKSRRMTLHASWPDGARAEAVMLAVKPQIMDQVAERLAPMLNENALIISIAAGRTIASLQHSFDGHPIIRAMPNTPVAVGKGVTVFVGDESVTDAHRKLTREIFAPGGLVEEVDNEALLDAVTAVSGSGPAYVFLLAESLAGAAKAAEIPDDLADTLARQTLIGAAALMEISDDSPAKMRQDVTSRGGTTDAALNVLYDDQDTLPRLIRRAIDAAVRRGKELGR